MERFVVDGPCVLKGEVCISTGKNAVLPILAAALLCRRPCIIEKTPLLSDVRQFESIFRALGVSHHLEGNRFTVCAEEIGTVEVPEDCAGAMRASVLILGPLLARNRQACLAMPGGCGIGTRPIDLHLEGLRKMGASLEIRGGMICAEAEKGLHGAEICLDFPSVGATENLMTAAVLADGRTRIDHAAREPEIVDLANFLKAMGARVRGAGTDNVLIEGVPADSLQGVRYTPMPDRMEAATWMIAAAATGGDVLVHGAQAGVLRAVCAKLTQSGARIIRTPGGLRVQGSVDRKPNFVRTMQYPGFPTDAQALMTVLLCRSKGVSMVTETVFENRFRYVQQLARMGAQIRQENQTLYITGVDRLSGAGVLATDLRAGAAMILAGCCAQGKTTVNGAAHILRGYENMAEKWQMLGASVVLEQ